MNIKLIINKLQTIPKWYGWIMVIIYSLLLAEFISTLNNLIMYGVVLSNIYEVFMKLGYFITIIPRWRGFVNRALFRICKIIVLYLVVFD